MVDQRWYELVGRFTKLTPATNQFQVEVRLYDWGTNGITGGTLVGTNFVVNATGAASGLPTLWADSDVYAGFRAAVASGSGTRFLDDFTLPQDTITFRDGMPMDGTPRRFIRLRISSP
jgi:hypothetical protein